MENEPGISSDLNQMADGDQSNTECVIFDVQDSIEVDPDFQTEIEVREDVVLEGVSLAGCSLPTVRIIYPFLQDTGLWNSFFGNFSIFDQKNFKKLINLKMLPNNFLFLHSEIS